jgi:hypothetical protein
LPLRACHIDQMRSIIAWCDQKIGSNAAVPITPMSPDTQPCTWSCKSSSNELKSPQSVAARHASTLSCVGNSSGEPGERVVVCRIGGLVCGRLMRKPSSGLGWPSAPVRAVKMAGRSLCRGGPSVQSHQGSVTPGTRSRIAISQV